jgi:hypothetical protein
MKFQLENQSLRIDFSRTKIGTSVVTVCTIKDEHNVPYLTGKASVNTDKYNFCKEIGRKLSLARAIANLPSKADRTIIWQAYFSRKSNQLINNVLQNV